MERMKDTMSPKYLGDNTQQSVLKGLGQRAAMIQRQQRDNETGEQLSQGCTDYVGCMW